jgi:hypothetical protein
MTPCVLRPELAKLIENIKFLIQNSPSTDGTVSAIFSAYSLAYVSPPRRWPLSDAPRLSRLLMIEG